MTENQARQHLEENGYAVIEQSEYEKLVRERQHLKTKIENQSDQTESGDNQSNSESVKIYQFKVNSGMSLSELASQLEELNIIDDAESFSQFMENNNYSRNVQLGEFELHNRLTYEQIANILTKMMMNRRAGEGLEGLLFCM
ncbi:endolytic transglycosylase MltG [Piscibacillus salipiscarius]|uniref:endolytic transglycosylase MltG n=1 Tax=Piscibacillus salipiscarius TaxID=299480 RepID=UPI0006D04ECE|nr:endolytic transglycosylase MltG [Piscibacillus salipiscarius]